jgi:hypothetical protein
MRTRENPPSLLLLLALAGPCAGLTGCDTLWGRFTRAPDAGVCNNNVVCWGGPALHQDFPTRPAVDVLFVIDNSRYMRVKQQALAQAAVPFFDRLHAADAEYHVGITSTNIGSVPAGASGFAPFERCGSVAGDDGKLLSVSCRDQGDIWFTPAEGQQSCDAACPAPGQRLKEGTFIFRGRVGTNVDSIMEGGREVGPARAFGCLALLGDKGCELEGPLEAARRVFRNQDNMNAAFLRQGTALGVFFLTDEDDCSVKASERSQNENVTTPCPPGPISYKCYHPDYRCMALSLQCNEAMNVPGSKTGCKEVPSYLSDVSQLAAELKALRPDGKLLVAGIWPPSLSAGGKLEVRSMIMGTSESYTLDRGLVPGEASCAASSALTGRAQVRLSSYLANFPTREEIDLCAADGYGAGLVRAADRLLGLEARCLDGDIWHVEGQQSCLVGDVRPGETIPESYMPACSKKCCSAWATATSPVPSDPGISAACQDEAQTCHCAVQNPACARTGGTVAGVIRRGPAPDDKVVHFRCGLKRE